MPALTSPEPWSNIYTPYAYANTLYALQLSVMTTVTV